MLQLILLKPCRMMGSTWVPFPCARHRNPGCWTAAGIQIHPRSCKLWSGTLERTWLYQVKYMELWHPTDIIRHFMLDNNNQRATELKQAPTQGNSVQLKQILSLSLVSVANPNTGMQVLAPDPNMLNVPIPKCIISNPKSPFIPNKALLCTCFSAERRLKENLSRSSAHFWKLLKYCGDEFGIETSRKLDTELNLLTAVLSQGTGCYVHLDWIRC